MERVLIIRVGHLGDSVLATTILDPLRKVFSGDLHVDFAVEPHALTAPLLRSQHRGGRMRPMRNGA